MPNQRKKEITLGRIHRRLKRIERKTTAGLVLACVGVALLALVLALMLMGVGA